ALTLALCLLCSVATPPSAAKAPASDPAQAPPIVETEAPPEAPVAAPTAVTSPEEAAKLHYTHGMAAFKAGAFYDAARSFDAAHAALPRPVLLLNAGRAWERAEDLLRALARFKALREDQATPPQLLARGNDGYRRVMAALAAQSAAVTNLPAQHALTGAPQGAPLPSEEVASGLSWEWFGIRVFAGVYNITDERAGMFWEGDTQPMLTGELVFFTMLWDWGYWDILRVGAGWPMVLTWGGSIGYRQRWGRHELRTGLHLTNLVLPFPVSSGAEAIYLHRYDSFNLEAGVRIHAFPTSLTGFVGMKF
ncbi:MAG: hypothetical protein ACPGU1_11785, partial [Myxococcota bacterium]